jgi:hypothetical protein
MREIVIFASSKIASPERAHHFRALHTRVGDPRWQDLTNWANDLRVS